MLVDMAQQTQKEEKVDTQKLQEFILKLTDQQKGGRGEEEGLWLHAWEYSIILGEKRMTFTTPALPKWANKLH